MVAEISTLVSNNTRHTTRPTQYFLNNSVVLPSDEVKREPFKRAFDILFSSFAIIGLAPFFIVIALLIKLFSPNGPIIFGHERIGRNGQPFQCYKFRTMVPNAEEVLEKLLDSSALMRKEYQKDFKLRKDPRIIPGIGEFLRKSSLDELPQFFNVFLGDMSVIGPRPIVESEKTKYGQYLQYLLSIRPGISGLWQVSGRNDITYSERVLLDMYYIKKRNLIYDTGLILKTVYVMLFRKGAY